MRALRKRLHHVVHWGFIAGLVAYIGIRISHASVPSIYDVIIGFAVGVAVTFLLSLTRLGDDT